MFVPIFLFSFRTMRQALLALFNSGMGNREEKQVTTLDLMGSFFALFKYLK
ncbi:TPA: hypothetical protein ACGQXI_005828 [Klebsiella michiganensis]|jgi:hypothetical protein|uniref:hypothetical protein n=1 Tax=Raoultella ornithinolytica TaxID=54291 RepID=UPI00292C400E|nr:hypothetical protein [Raoultella ornithinolytica]MDV1096439.1 hypothetical protein [Raoultella ornithinolytica]MDV1124235.1 hypothetical protein [Raoultella ornithinolytica]MDV1894582.1 hypothetical protein [Raoultella ornithinolytica]